MIQFKLTLFLLMMKKSLPCTVCGYPAKFESFCEKHWLERKKLFDLQSFSIEVCDKCGSWRDNKWHEAVTAKDAVKLAVLNKIKFADGVECVNAVVDARLPNTIKPGKAATAVRAVCKVGASDARVEKLENIDVRLKWIKCEDCIKLSGRYHEATFQLRGARAASILEAVRDSLASKPYSIEQTKHGYNVFIVHKGSASSLCRELRSAGFEVLRSFKHVSQKDGKKLFRDFYAVR